MVIRSESVPITDIVIPPNRRRLNEEKVKSIAGSIKNIGLLHPVGITADYVLVHGRHRIEGCKLLGIKTIDCRIIEASDLLTRLAEIDENLERAGFDTALAEAQALKERKDIYEALHPETKQHVAGGYGKSASANIALAGTATKNGQNPATDIMSVAETPSFAADTAEKAGVTERTVRRGIQLAEDISEPVQEAIADLPIADNKAELKRLAALSGTEQKHVADKLASGKAKTVAEASGKTAEPTDPWTTMVKMISKVTRYADDVAREHGKSHHHSKIVEKLGEAYELANAWGKAARAKK